MGPEDKVITPDDVLKLTSPTEGYLCKLNANTYGIDFLEFEVKNTDTGKTLFKVARDPNSSPLPTEVPPEYEDALRSVKYTFPAEFLRCKGISTMLIFRVGDQPVPDFRMVERHYLKGKLLRSYDFKFGFCIPNSTNSWEALYTMPQNSEKQIEDFIKTPFGHQSDSFYFVGDRMIMHNKASYQYEP